MASSSGETTSKIGPTQYSYEELANATGHFSNRYFLGEGGYGQVFWGSLDGKTRAIKKLRCLPDDEKTKQKMMLEIKIANRVRHPNVAHLVGYCIEANNALLVLEYFPKKSLKYNLHEEFLDWQKRMQIAKGVAKGLEYLHESCDPRIIHLDIKPDNILMDNNFKPKITDFGLALYFPDNVTHLSKSNNEGTKVYMDPEQQKNFLISQIFILLVWCFLS
ncbi:proline-rich receptor-like protein kinase PERK15 [Hevea brasiliensis]|uniref:proline-rich receptor-like protein kinase PERK15 n=1 Tax=Hevea brasiliensis TaxID=3981 RepID=UPI0025FF2480|nr:proline-rich receptor-like protein kinase PERK15 [Hevea brasiliensis]